MSLRLCLDRGLGILSHGRRSPSEAFVRFALSHAFEVSLSCVSVALRVRSTCVSGEFEVVSGQRARHPVDGSRPLKKPLLDLLFHVCISNVFHVRCRCVSMRSLCVSVAVQVRFTCF